MLLISKVFTHSRKIPEDYGFRHLKFKFQNDPVDVIVISKKGDERMAKPLFFYCQENAPQPVIRYDEKGLFGILPFDENPLLEHFHVIVVGMPFIPVISDINRLDAGFNYLRDFEKRSLPKGYTERNYLDYYVFRNNFILRQLGKERWVRSRKLIVAGHAEGSSIAVKMAMANKKITQLIYSGGNPYGKMASILAASRFSGKDSAEVFQTILHWKTTVENVKNGNNLADKTIYGFSLPQKENLMQLPIPVLITYSDRDWSSSHNDLFMAETIGEGKTNFCFKDYPAAENSAYNWEMAAGDWVSFAQNGFFSATA